MKFSTIQVLAAGAVLSTGAAAQSCAGAWAQCGGAGWTGPTCCVAGSTCVKNNEWYSQCLEGAAPPAAATTTQAAPPPAAVTTQAPPPVAVTTSSSKAPAPATTLIQAPSPAAAQASAFPGAEGLGRNAIGGRTGTVYKVTNLNDSGAGSLRDAVSQPNRIVVFTVGGVIKIETRIVVNKNIYIAGQTAPGDGITVYGNGFSWSNAHNAITRYIRIRMGRGGDSGKDAITIADGDNMIFDHVSVSWGRDETFSISGTAANITVQDTIIAQGLETHSCGGLMETDGGISLFRNLYIDNKTRNPKVKGVNDFQNNVVYNWGGGGGYIAGDSSAASYANIINNYFISGPSTSATAFTRGNANFRGFVSNNFYDSDRDGTLDGSALCVSTTCYSNMAIQTSQFNYPGPEKLLSPAAAVEHVAAKVGASLKRDAVDTALVAQLRSWGKNGALIDNESAMGGVGTIAGGTAPADADGDGIPDAWERANGLDPNNAADGMKISASGYTNLEVYVNSLAPGTYA